MNMMDRRQRLDRAVALLADAKISDNEKRLELDKLFREAESDACREHALIGAAIALVAGGDVVIPPGTLAGLAISGGFFLEENTQTGELRVRVVRSLAAAVATAQEDAREEQRQIAAAPPLAAIEGDVPAANPAEPDGIARARICDAIKTFLQRHYDGEMRGRGFGFFETIAGELLAVAVGVRLANDPDPDLPAPHLQALLEELVPRVLHYQSLADQLKDAAPQPEPGEPAKPNLSRLH